MTQTYPKIPEHVQKLPKMSAVFQNKFCVQNGKVETAQPFSSPNLRTCIAKHDLAPCAFYLKMEVLSFTHSFYFLHWFDWKYFWKLCQKSCNHSHFLIRLDNLAVHKSARDWSFQSASVRLRAQKIFEFHLAHWASNPQGLLAQGTSHLPKFSNSFIIHEHKNRSQTTGRPILIVVLLVLTTFMFT